MKLLSAPANLVREARWNETGAVCLDKPRVDVHPTTNSIDEFGTSPSVYQQAMSQCALRGKVIPACAGGAFDRYGHRRRHGKHDQRAFRIAAASGRGPAWS